MDERIAWTLNVRCPELKTISVSHIHVPPAFRAVACTFENLHQNLRQFNYLNMEGNLLEERARVVRVLINCPQLDHLGLSISPRAICEDGLNQRWERYWLWFDELCDKYEEDGGQPLRLKSIFFGEFIFPTRLTSLPKLSDVSYIEQINMDNLSHLFLCEQDSVSLRPINRLPPIAFDTFEPPKCPRLDRFTVNHNSRAVIILLNKFPKTPQPAGARPMAVLLSTKYYDWDPRPKNVLLDTLDEATGHSLLSRTAHLQLGTKNMDYELLYRGPGTEPLMLPSVKWHFSLADQTIRILTSPRHRALKGLSVELKDLGHDITMNSQGWTRLKTTIRQLPCLTELAVNTCREPCDCLSQGVWDKQKSYLDIDSLALDAPGLKFINFRCGYWRVWPQGNGGRLLERLERHEISAVELFHGHPASGRSVLPFESP